MICMGYSEFYVLCVAFILHHIVFLFLLTLFDSRVHERHSCQARITPSEYQGLFLGVMDPSLMPAAPDD